MLLISNGHGEDVVGARLAQALRDRRDDLHLLAMPVVGPGTAYREGPAIRIGPLQSMPSGGTTLHTLSGALRDLRAGLLGMTLAQVRDLRAVRADALVSVGDVFVQALGLLPRVRARYSVQTLVSARMASGAVRGLAVFRQRFTPLERLLVRRAYRRVYLRDDDSAAWLRARGVPQAVALGNPMMDGLDQAPLALPSRGARILALPGSRASAASCLAAMAEALGRLHQAEVVIAWTAAEDPALPGWRAAPTPVGDRAWQRGGVRLHLVRGRFAAALAWAESALGATGTAQEQAAGRGVPVVSFPCGAAGAAGFLANQRRLLGEALQIAPPDPEAIAAALAGLHADPHERERRGAIGRERMGAAGGSRRIVADLLGDAVGADVLPPAARVG